VAEGPSASKEKKAQKGKGQKTKGVGGALKSNKPCKSALPWRGKRGCREGIKTQNETLEMGPPIVRACAFKKKEVPNHPQNKTIMRTGVVGGERKKAKAQGGEPKRRVSGDVFCDPGQKRLE